MVAKALYPAIIWGIGTALGELPPYATSYAARKAGLEDESYQEFLNGKSSFELVSRMKSWMVDFLQKYGFFGVFLMSAWPNAMFDLVGLCCGHFLMPFYSFISAVILGKGIVKVTGQIIFFVSVFSEATRESLKSVIGGGFIGMKLHAVIDSVISKFSGEQDTKEETSTNNMNGLVGKAFQYLIMGVILLFVKSVIEQFAQQKQKQIDNSTLRRSPRLKAKTN